MMMDMTTVIIGLLFVLLYGLMELSVIVERIEAKGGNND